MKKIMKHIITFLLIISVLVIASCSNVVNTNAAQKKESSISEQGIATVKMFVPDYYLMAEQGANRAIAPQSVKARLSYNVSNLGWIGVSTVELSSAQKTPVENAPEGFTGSIYTITFDGVPVGEYQTGNLQIELLDSSGNIITSGVSTTDVSIAKGASASTTFYTLPQTIDGCSGNLIAGEMKFSLQTLYTGIIYKVSMTTSSDYPDLVLFDSNGKLLNYYPIDSAQDVAQIEVETSGNYYVGVWADDGNNIARYSYSFGQLKYYTDSMCKGITYDLVVTTDGQKYPDLICFDSEGHLLNYYTIEDEESAHIKIDITKTDTYTFILYGAEKDSLDLSIGKFKFVYANLVSGIPYDVIVNTTENKYPDFALFTGSIGAEGYIAEELISNSFKTIASENESHFTIQVENNGSYLLGLYGMNPDAYSLSFDLSSGTPLSGVLTGTNLHWTQENSPYIVNANILVEEGTELVIDPGVIVQFTGDYYLKVTGTISAVGNKTEPIIFIPSGNNLSNWNGIKIDSTIVLNLTNTYTYASGSILKNCMVVGASTPLWLNSAAYVDSCLFTEGGSLSIQSTSLLINNTIDRIYVSSNPIIVNNKIAEYADFDWTDAKIYNNTFSNADIYFRGYESFAFESNIINACSIRLDRIYSKIVGNNFLGYTDIILDASNCYYADRKTFNFTGNYWGEVQTAEIESKCGSGVSVNEKDYNMSFFTDYYDNFENTKIDFSNWATAPIEGAGYLGDGFIAFDYTINGYDFSTNGYYPESKDTALLININPKYHTNDITYVRVAQGLADLTDSEWEAYSTNKSLTVDKNKLENDAATIYVQLKDSKGNVSSPVMHEVPFDSPVVTLSIADGMEYTNPTGSESLSYSATDKGKIAEYALYLDDLCISSSQSSGWGRNFSNSYNLGLAYMTNGSHKLKATFWDAARNEASKEIIFTINRNVDTSNLTGNSYDETTGQLLKDDRTLYLWHFDSDGNESDGDSSLVIESFTAQAGGLQGFAESITKGTTTIPVELTENAFTVEAWRKGNGSFSIQKSNVFSISSNSLSRYYTTSSGSQTNDGISCSSSLFDDNWHFWSYVYGGTYMAIYRDGKLVCYKDNLTQILNTNDNKLYIYAYNIDELRISSVARSPDEIAAYYNAAKSLIVE